VLGLEFALRTGLD